MVKQVPLQHDTHADLRVITHPSERFGDNIGFVGVITREYQRLVGHYPIFFRKNSENGRFEPGVLLGFNGAENLYLVNERWDADYVPLHVQRQPFLIAPLGDGHTVTIDIENPRVQTEAGERLFEGANATEYLQKITSVLRELAEGTGASYAYAAKLAEFDLIEPVRLDIEFVDHSEIKLEGLYSIGAAKLQALPAEKLVELRDLGFLQLAYFQLASLSHIAGVVARKNHLISGIK